MPRLVGGTHFIVLRAGEDVSERAVYSHRRFDEVLSKWDARSRVSPIFALDNSPHPALGVDTPVWLVFAGPIFPGRIDPSVSAGSYLTLGLLNCLFFCQSEPQLASIHRLIEICGARWEEWEIRAHRVTNVRAGGWRDIGGDRRPRLEEVTLPTDAFVPTFRELQTLFATAMARTDAHSHREWRDDFERFGSQLALLIASSGLNNAEKLGMLVTTNVAMSRQLWQTYTGSNPICGNACHIATHSLLAVGTASLALRTLAKSLEAFYERIDIPGRLQALKAVPAHQQNLLHLPSHDAFWQTGVLYPDATSRSSLSPTQEPQAKQHLPLITYFSSRDGFKSTDLSLSAPVEVISACNSTAWTLQTLSHELTHTLIHSVMGQLLVRFDDVNDATEICNSLRGGYTYKSLHDQFRAFFTFAVWRSQGGMVRSNFETFLSRVQQNLRDADEVMTHVFDFLFHYRADPTSYIKAVWVSWATIPNIGDRVSKYIVRSLCAIHSANLRRDDGINVSIDQLKNALATVETEFPESQYVSQAISDLQARRSVFEEELANHVLLIKFVRFVLYSESLARDLATGRDDISALKNQAFDSRTISNPLAFVEMWSQDKEPNIARSVWILQYLAYGVSQ